MSEITPKFLNEYELAVQEAQEKLHRMRELAQCLVPHLPQPHKVWTFGYCADLGMRLALPESSEQDSSALAAELLKSYPPLETVFLPEYVSFKPREYLRGAEFSAIQRTAFPVCFLVDAHDFAKGPDASVKYTARWWTRLSVGVVEVLAEGLTPAMLGLTSDAYDGFNRLISSNQQLMYSRRLLKVPLGRQVVLDSWLDALQSFADSLPNPGGRSVVFAVKSRLFDRADEVVTLDMLLGNPSLKYNPFARLQPWKYLSEEKAQELVNLANRLAPELEDIVVKAKPTMREAVDQAHALVSELLSGYSQVSDPLLVREVLQQKVGQQVGQGVEVTLFQYNTRMKALTARVIVKLGEFSPAVDVFKEVVCPCEPGKPVLQVADLNPEFVPL